MYEKLVNMIAKQLDLDPEIITPESTFVGLGIDSLDLVETVMTLENELGIELDTEDHKIETMQDLVDFVESKLN